MHKKHNLARRMICLFDKATDVGGEHIARWVIKRKKSSIDVHE